MRESRLGRALSKYLVDMQQRNLHQGYVRQSELTLGRFVMFCKHRGVESPSKIEKPLVKEWLGQFADKSGGTQRMYWTMLRSFLVFCENPVPLTYRHRVRGPERFTVIWLDAEQMYQLLQSDLTPRETVMVYLSMLAGLRRGEALAITVSEAERGMATGWLPVKGKGYKPRLVPVHPRLREALEKYLESVELGPHDKLLPFSYSRYGQIMLEIEAKTKIPCASHELRRSYAKEGVKVADLGVVSAVLGHQSTTTTLRYVGDRMDEMKLMVERLPFVTQSVQVEHKPAV